MFTMEVFYKAGQENTVDNLERVEYGPFSTRDDAEEFFADGVTLGVFNPNHKVIHPLNSPSYRHNYREKA